jgi:thymidylate synthase ThyX
MTEVTAKIVEDSISEGGARLTTMQLRYPRWIHGEFMTHRVFSRNASSSRAIPTKKMLESIEANPAEPLFWGLNEPGMQSRKEITEPTALKAAKAMWLHPMRVCIRAAQEMAELCGLHKQISNRVIETWQHIDVIVSSTDFDNFFALRCHPDAEPTIQVLAWEMADALYNSQPTLVSNGGWHLPYIKPEERESLPLDVQKFCSVARCARVSYRTHDGANPTVEKDKELYQRLLAGLDKGNGEPGHLSPLEHQATPLADPKSRSGNFVGWEQYRKQIPGEAMAFDYEAAIAKGWRDMAQKIKPKKYEVLVRP